MTAIHHTELASAAQARVNIQTRGRQLSMLAANISHTCNRMSSLIHSPREQYSRNAFVHWIPGLYIFSHSQYNVPSFVKYFLNRFFIHLGVIMILTGIGIYVSQWIHQLFMNWILETCCPWLLGFFRLDKNKTLAVPVQTEHDTSAVIFSEDSEFPFRLVILCAEFQTLPWDIKINRFCSPS